MDTLDLIEQAREAQRLVFAAGGGLLLTRLADALEAAEAEAKLQAEIANGYLLRVDELQSERNRLRQEAMALYERVEMDESVGICLSSRVEALNLGALLMGHLSRGDAAESTAEIVVAENERWREALGRIAHGLHDEYHDWNTCQVVARTALREARA